MIFQDPMTSLDPSWRVGDQVAEPLRLHRGLDASAARTRAISLLEAVDFRRPLSLRARIRITSRVVSVSG